MAGSRSQPLRALAHTFGEFWKSNRCDPSYPLGRGLATPGIRARSPGRVFAAPQQAGHLDVGDLLDLDQPLLGQPGQFGPELVRADAVAQLRKRG